MLTLDALRAYGANVDEGLARCVNNEAFYLRMVGLVLADVNFDKLKDAAAAKDTPAMFEAAHALKGATGNVSLTPLYDLVCKLTELTRGQTGPVDADGLVDEILEKLSQARQL